MQKETITIPDGAENRVITVDYLNQLGAEIGELSNSIVRDGIKLLYKYLEAGEALTIKKAQVDKAAPGTWVIWCNENLSYSKDSEERYRSLFRNSARVRKGIEDGEITSLRTACALISQEASEGDEETQYFGSTPPEKEKEEKPVTKIGTALAKFWTVFHRNPPAKWGERERSDFLLDLAERELVRRNNGWKLPVIDVEAEEVKP